MSVVLADTKVELAVYGSTATGFALKDSDLNIDLCADNSAHVLANVHLILKEESAGR